MVGMTQLAIAGEHGGSEHGGSTHKQEHGGSEHGGSTQEVEPVGSEPVVKVTRVPSKLEIKAAMKSHVMTKQRSSGTFNITDPDTGKMRKLILKRVHERVGKTGDYYYSCADFKDTESGEMLDLDLDVADTSGRLRVVDVRIHKVSGDARYTYDDNDNRIPLVEGTKSHLGAKSVKGSSGKDSLHKGSSGQEHGGKEHGG